MKGSILICYNRDPSEKDIHHEEDTIWISTEYIPNRIFRGGNGKWIFIGKFFPEGRP